MRIKRKSVITGIERIRDIPVNPDDWIMYNLGYMSIHDAMPYLNDEDVEFIISGISENEWSEAFANIEE